MKYKFKILTAALILFSISNIFSTEKDIYNTVQNSYKNQNYYNAITETMRYEALYPEGLFLNDLLILKSKSYFFGGNTQKAFSTLRPVLESNNIKYNAKAEFNIIYMQLLRGSAYVAHLNINKYLKSYDLQNPEQTEKLHVEKAYSYALIDNYSKALVYADKYKKIYPDGKYVSTITEFEALVLAEKNKELKSYKTAIIGSIFIPGFSYFYTENYLTGFISLFSNIALTGLTAYNISKSNYFEAVVFGYLEFTFYQYSLTACKRNVDKYNSRDSFKENLRLSIQSRF